MSDGGSSASGPDRLTWDDATWILTSSFMIFTMQSGFAIWESGFVSSKNEVNIMMKNAIDIIFGGISFWFFGFGLAFGTDPGTNPFCGVGNFFTDTKEVEVGKLFATFTFQLSLKTTASTIASGAIAERTKLVTYMIYSFFGTLLFSFPAHWQWAGTGFLRRLGCTDVAGAGAVHTVGGISAMVAAKYIKPRLGRYDKGTERQPLGNPANVIVGMFMLWWGWLTMSSGSTFGISGGKWKLAGRSAANSLIGAIAAGFTGALLSLLLKKRRYDVMFTTNSVIAGLVALNASCSVVHTWEAFLIGCIASPACLGTIYLLDRLYIDDPCGAVGVHAGGGIWGLVAVGIFADLDPLENLTQGQRGLFHGGGVYLLGIQLLTIICESVWSAIITLILFVGIDKTIGARLERHEELIGADYVEHGIGEIQEVKTENHLSRPSTTATVHRLTLQHVLLKPPSSFMHSKMDRTPGSKPTVTEMIIPKDYLDGTHKKSKSKIFKKPKLLSKSKSRSRLKKIKVEPAASFLPDRLKDSKGQSGLREGRQRLDKARDDGAREPSPGRGENL